MFQVLINGAVLGSVYALIALGLAWELWLAPTGNRTWAIKVLPLEFHAAQKIADVRHEFEHNFDGMTAEPVELDALLAAREVIPVITADFAVTLAALAPIMRAL